MSNDFDKPNRDQRKTTPRSGRQLDILLPMLVVLVLAALVWNFWPITRSAYAPAPTVQSTTVPPAAAPTQ